VSGQPAHRIAASGLCFVPEHRGIFRLLSVEENLRLGARRDSPWQLDDIYRIFPRLKERRRNGGAQLSGGEQQMLAVGRALMLRPKLMLLDEPSFGLAPLIVEEVFSILRRINEQQKVSMLLVEQNATLALDLADHAYLLETGTVVISGTSKEIAADETVRRSYLGY
jgi:branched-chain amino acid transport system ATP-binding protein